MIFLSAQPDNFYMKWQLEVLLVNLKKIGVKKNQIHILVGYDHKMGLSEVFKDLIDEFGNLACFFVYPDTRDDIQYQPSIRPHIIKKHFLQNMQMENEVIFYHDADIIFRELPDFQSLVHDDVWYLSDTTKYISAKSIINNAGRYVLEEMCQVIGVDQRKIEDNHQHSGGAQYLMKNTNYQFWDKIEHDSTLLYRFLIENEKRFEEKFVRTTNRKIDSYVGVIAWCADMWAILWNAFNTNYKVRISKELDFCWPKDSLNRWNETKIFHNAGLDTGDASSYFYKSDFFNATPFDLSFDYVLKNCCSVKYVDAIKEAKEFKKVNLTDVTFLIPVRVDSSERLENLVISTTFLLDCFKTNIIVLEADSSRKIPSSSLSNKIQYIFRADTEINFHRTKYNNEMITMSKSPIIVLYDLDIIVESRQIIEAVEHIRSGRAKIALPYDGRFVSINSDVQKKKFFKTMDTCVLQNSEAKYTSGSACGGVVLLDSAVYKDNGMENEDFFKWGPEDIERLRRLKILGFAVKKVEGIIYHLYHPPYINSGYRTDEEKIQMLSTYVDIANKTKVELQQHINEKKTTELWRQNLASI